MPASPIVVYILRRADDALILGHRLSEWCGHAPLLEEDLALANIGLDLIGQARALYTHAATLEGDGRDEDSYAYHRDAPKFRNLLLVEQPNGDFAHTIIRLLLYGAFAEPYWQAMTASADPMLSAIAGKSVKEIRYHLRHAAEWTIRLGDGTDESKFRAQQALDALWSYTGEMFETDAAEQALIAAGTVIDPAILRAPWQATLADILHQATLRQPATEWMRHGGRAGRHSEHLGPLLEEMQFLARTHPGATW